MTTSANPRPFWRSSSLPDPVPLQVVTAETSIPVPAEDDGEAARELLDQQAAAAGRAWVGKATTNATTAGFKDWSFLGLTVLSAGEKGAATGGGAA